MNYVNNLKSKLIMGVLVTIILATAGVSNAKAQTYLQELRCHNQWLFVLQVLEPLFGTVAAVQIANDLERNCINEAITWNNTAKLQFPYPLGRPQTLITKENSDEIRDPIKEEKYLIENLLVST
jgi:hypothetical protein